MNYDDLSDDELREVLLNLKVKDIAKLSENNSRIYNFLHTDNFWCSLLKRDYNKSKKENCQDAYKTEYVHQRNFTRQNMVAFFSSIERGEYEIVKEFLEKGFDTNINYGNFILSSVNNLDMLNLLLDYGFDINKTFPMYKINPSNKTEKIIDLLLQEGLTVDEDDLLSNIEKERQNRLNTRFKRKDQLTNAEILLARIYNYLYSSEHTRKIDDYLYKYKTKLI